MKHCLKMVIKQDIFRQSPLKIFMGDIHNIAHGFSQSQIEIKKKRARHRNSLPWFSLTSARISSWHEVIMTVCQFQKVKEMVIPIRCQMRRERRHCSIIHPAVVQFRSMTFASTVWEHLQKQDSFTKLHHTLKH